ncbi:ribonuclease H-like domain-containing protein [Tanacetum coccineum]
MSVHNSENGDDYIEDPDPVTLISKLDISDPLHLHPNVTTALTIVSIKLKGNYQVLSCAMLLALEGKNKTGFIDGTCKRSNTDEVLGKQWARVNAIVLGWILNSISEELFLCQMAKHVWANQHMTYTDKELDNVLDITHLRIKVGHPNGTKVYISKIGNLKLSNGLTLYDVMVVPEYCVTLISVHKLAKENKLGHPAEPVLNVLKDSLQIDKKDNIIPNDDERVYNDMNRDKRSQSDSSSSFVSGRNHNTADFPVDNPGNDADSSGEFVAIQNKGVATLEENVFSEVKYGLENMSSGEIDKYKARLVAQGFRQKEGIDYEETFSPVVKMVTIRCLLNIVVSMSWPVFQLDVNNAFLYGDLEEAPTQWNDKLTSNLIENGFSQSNSDYSLYTKSDKGVFIYLFVYVDDIIITGNSVYVIEKFKVFLKSKFMIKDLGKLKPAKTPLMSKLVISNEACDNDPLLENVIDYQRLMGKLIYLTNTRPDISYVVDCLSQFMHSPLTSYLKIAFKILRYLKSCPGLGIHIAKTSVRNKILSLSLQLKQSIELLLQ